MAAGQSLEQFLSQTLVQSQGAGTSVSGPVGEPFEIHHDKFLKVNMAQGGVEKMWIKMGTMVAYTGEIKFKREGMLEHGIGNAIKKAITDEGPDLVKAKLVSDTAQLYLAEEGKTIALLRLNGDALIVNGNHLLAYELPNITHKITMMRSLSEVVSGGLFSVRLQGHGCVAILTHGKPLTLPLAPGSGPILTDPHATVAWSDTVVPEFHADISFRTFFGRGSGESFQMKFLPPPSGMGFVVVQPFEEIARSPPAASNSRTGGGSIVKNLFNV